VRREISSLVSSGKSSAYEALVQYNKVTGTMSELVEISKLNGSFKRNYGTFIGAYLYLRSIRAARGGSLFWPGLISIACSAAAPWLLRHGLA
jgi:hypothetical protein